jgi:two-component system sensor histidine kinase KdpD
MSSSPGVWTVTAARLRAPAGRIAAGVTIAAVLAMATLAAALLEAPTVGIRDASPIYLVAVVAVGILFGTWPAIVTAVASFLIYDMLFVEPRFTLTVQDPQEWLELLLFLIVGVAIGRLSALQNERAAEAARRARQAQALFRVSRALATHATVTDALRTIVTDLVTETEMERIWICRSYGARETIVADSASDSVVPQRSIHLVLARSGSDEGRWVRTHHGTPGAAEPPSGSGELFRVRIESGTEPMGSLWAARPRGAELPSAEETRLLALAADQLGLAYRREQLAAEANTAEIARQGDRVKSALLDSVSHDLQTPLASIRTAAGSLMDPAVRWTEHDARAIAASIDGEADRLSSLVRDVLDMSRIEAGALKPDLELFEVSELVEPVIKRLQSTSGAPVISFETLDELPPVQADAVFVDQVVTNLLENAISHARGARIRIRASADHESGSVVIRIEDAGPGVPGDELPRLFEKFHRVSRAEERSRRGLGIGLSVVKGLVEAMDGTVKAAQSELGGLAIDVSLRAGPAPPGERTPA